MHKGFGWVRMSSEQEVLQALDNKRHSIEGYEVEREGERGREREREMANGDLSSTYRHL